MTWGRGEIQRLGRRGVRTLLHLGDFGIWPGQRGEHYLLWLEEACASWGLTIYVTAGNHEDWDQLLSKRPDTRNEFGALLWFTEHIAVFPRDPAGHRFQFGGRSFVSLGGAPSLDRWRRTEGESWWAGEMIPAETAERVARDGYADVMLAHDAPDNWQTPRVTEVLKTNPWGWSDQELDYAAVGRQRLTSAFEGVSPRLFAHGHFHVADEATAHLPGRAYPTTLVSLSMQREAGNIALLDLDTLTVSWPLDEGGR